MNKYVQRFLGDGWRGGTDSAYPGIGSVHWVESGNHYGCGYAGMAAFHGEPHAIVEALITHQPVPPLADSATTMLFGPGLIHSCRMASPREVALWEALKTPVLFSSLSRADFSRDDVGRMLQEGIVELDQRPRPNINQRIRIKRTRPPIPPPT